MRRAGMLSALLVLVAVLFGLFSLVNAFGFAPGELFGLLWPVAVGVTLLSIVLLAFGRWSVRMLNEQDGSNQGAAAQKEGRPGDPMGG